MEAVKIVLELAVVLGAIVMGTRSSGVALGLWGGAGVAVLVFVFGEDVGSPPVDALLIVLSVVLYTTVETHYTFPARAKEAIYNAFHENGIEIPFPQRDVYIKPVPEKK